MGKIPRGKVVTRPDFSGVASSKLVGEKPVNFYRRPKLLAFSDQTYATAIPVDAPTPGGSA